MSSDLALKLVKLTLKQIWMKGVLVNWLWKSLMFGSFDIEEGDKYGGELV